MLTTVFDACYNHNDNRRREVLYGKTDHRYEYDDVHAWHVHVFCYAVLRKLPRVKTFQYRVRSPENPRSSGFFFLEKGMFFLAQNFILIKTLTLARMCAAVV